MWPNTRNTAWFTAAWCPRHPELDLCSRRRPNISSWAVQNKKLSPFIIIIDWNSNFMKTFLLKPRTKNLTQIWIHWHVKSIRVKQILTFSDRTRIICIAHVYLHNLHLSLRARVRWLTSQYTPGILTRLRCSAGSSNTLGQGFLSAFIEPNCCRSMYASRLFVCLLRHW